MSLSNVINLACPICHANSNSTGKVLEKKYTVFRCGACGLEFLNPQPNDDTLTAIYDADYFLGEPLPENQRRVSALKRDTARAYLDLVQSYAPKQGSSLFEIGCGTGDLLVEAQERGFVVGGVEISQHAADMANQRLKEERVSCGSVETISLNEQAYDICVLVDAIEHTRHPLKTLTAINHLLKPEGLIFIVTPSLNNWTAYLMGQWWLEYKTEHLFYFGNQSIKQALEQTGFTEITIQSNYKILSFNYIADHFERFFVPLLSPLIKILRQLLPTRLIQKPLNLKSSGMTVSARKKKG